MKVIVEKPKKINGIIELPGDKSITHRAFLFGSIARGKTVIYNYSKGKDCMTTLKCIENLGIKVERNEERIIIEGNEYREPEDVLNCENSGTTIRLLSGILASKPFYSVLTGDSSLRQRPMDRIIKPLREMGAEIYGRSNDKYPPLTIKGKKLKGINFKMEIPSAQVKSCIIFATIFADGKTEIEEIYQTRDHTERLLKFLDGNIRKEGTKIILEGNQVLKGKEIYIPGDFSSASYFIASTFLIPGASIIIKKVGLNPTRTGFLNVIERMGGKFKILNQMEISNEPVGDLKVEYTENLKGVEILPSEVPNIIDEIPIIAILGCIAKGKTVVSGAKELRVKESDRIKSITTELKKLGADIEEKEDGFIVKGGKKLKGTNVNSWNDHRIAMALTLASFIAEEKTIIENSECVDISFPEFFDKFRELGVNFKFS
ncbi:MAG: 3-phosphoshikimate 1-carboxyvinyltransferase [Candidatus Omnitrophica bacterium]|nr:3-phosphoshikimate 1-carboxyvinyltransferase [Candidatus Omnitrophota bacterium]MCM8806482.1 3-phosphoshikimate 1-carboxyvinyltransferase [Candidatus Omnitrophota bacterium]